MKGLIASLNTHPHPEPFRLKAQCSLINFDCVLKYKVSLEGGDNYWNPNKYVMEAPMPGQEPTIPKDYAIKQGYMSSFYHILKV